MRGRWEQVQCRVRSGGLKHAGAELLLIVKEVLGQIASVLTFWSNQLSGKSRDQTARIETITVQR